MGTGRITVELFSLEISVSVWKSLSCKAVGLSNLSAASWRRWEAWYSPSAEMIFARLSRSAWAWPAIDRCIPWGISTSFTSTTPALLLPRGGHARPPPLPLGLGLARHRPLHPLGNLHVLYLDHADLHPPRVRLQVDYRLQLFVYGLPVCEQVVEVLLAEDAP